MDMSLKTSGQIQPSSYAVTCLVVEIVLLRMVVGDFDNYLNYFRCHYHKF